MKIISFFSAIAITFFLLSLGSKKSDTEIIQHKPVLNQKSEQPVKQIVFNVDREVIPETHPNKLNKVNVAPKKSLYELKIDAILIEEQGDGSENAAALYFELANSLVDSNLYQEAIDAFKKAEKHGFKDLKTLYFKIARTYALSGEYFGSMEDYLIKAKDNGFRNYRSLIYDKAFQPYKNEYDFMYHYRLLFKDNKKAMFKLFTHLAYKKSLKSELVMDPEALFENTSYEFRKESDYYTKNPKVNGHFDEFVSGVEDASFSRGGGNDYRYVLALTKNKNFSAVIYSEEDSWSDYILAKKYRLVTYDKSGNKISELVIASRGSLKKCKTFVFRPDFTFDVTENKIELKKGATDLSEESGENIRFSDLKSYSKVKTTAYRINAEGRIIHSDNVMLSMN